MIQLRIAVAERHVWVSGKSGRKVRQFDIEGPCADQWPGLRTCLTDYVKQPRRLVSAVVVVMPPLVSVRVLAFPRVTTAEARDLVEKSPARYFADSREAQIIGVRRLPSVQRRQTRVLAATMKSDLRDLIMRELNACNVRPTRLLCAHDSWLQSRGARRSTHIVAHLGEEIELLHLNKGALMTIRRLRQGAAAEDYIQANGSKPRVAVMNNGDTGALAVRNANRRPRLVLQDRAEKNRTARSNWTKALLRLALSAAFITLAGAIELHRQSAALSGIRDARAELKPRLAAAVRAQSSVLRSEEDLRALQQLEWSAERWSKVLTTLAEDLPAEGHLVVLRARKDTMTLEGYSADPGIAFDELRGSGVFDRLDVVQPIAREPVPGGDPRLKFVFQGRLHARGITP